MSSFCSQLVSSSATARSNSWRFVAASSTRFGVPWGWRSLVSCSTPRRSSSKSVSGLASFAGKLAQLARNITAHPVIHARVFTAQGLQVDGQLAGVGSDAHLDLLAIENVGNLVCPTGFDLGEDTRVALLSVTEGEDKPLKYPLTCRRADVVVITKTDLAGPCEWDRATALEAICRVAPVNASSRSSSTLAR